MHNFFSDIDSTVLLLAHTYILTYLKHTIVLTCVQLLCSCSRPKHKLSIVVEDSEAFITFLGRQVASHNLLFDSNSVILFQMTMNWSINSYITK